MSEAIVIDMPAMTELAASPISGGGEGGGAFAPKKLSAGGTGGGGLSIQAGSDSAEPPPTPLWLAPLAAAPPLLPGVERVTTTPESSPSVRYVSAKASYMMHCFEYVSYVNLAHLGVRSHASQQSTFESIGAPPGSGSPSPRLPPAKPDEGVNSHSPWRSSACLTTVI